MSETETPQTPETPAPLPKPGEAFLLPEGFRAEFDLLDAEFRNCADRIDYFAAQHEVAVMEARTTMLAIWHRIIETVPGMVDLGRYEYLTARLPDGKPMVVVKGDRPQQQGR